MTDNENNWRPKVALAEKQIGRPYRHSKIDPGQDFEALTEKHGRPFGPFDKERQLPYKGGKP